MICIFLRNKKGLLFSFTEKAVKRGSHALTQGPAATLNMAAGVVLPTFPSLALDLGLGAAGVSVLVAIPSAIRLLLNLFMGPSPLFLDSLPTVCDFI